MRAIVGQQLSTTVARVIWGRLLERFGGRAPTPQEILDDDPEPLRAAVGLSRAKVGFLRSLAEHVTSGELDLDHVSTLSDEELIAELTAVKGIGEWSAHMFLMFQLERPGHPRDRGPRRAPRARARLRARGAALRRGADGDRRAVAAVPQRRLPRAVVDRSRTGLRRASPGAAACRARTRRVARQCPTLHGWRVSSRAS